MTQHENNSVLPYLPWEKPTARTGEQYKLDTRCEICKNQNVFQRFITQNGVETFSRALLLKTVSNQLSPLQE